MAKKYSNGKTKDEGGYLGWVYKGKAIDKNSAKKFEGEIYKNGVLNYDIEKKVFDMRLFEVSAPIKTNFGYHIIKVMDKKRAGYLPFEKVKKEVRRDYINWQKDIKAHNTIVKALSALDKGEKFSEVAKKYSDGKTAKKGGDLPWFPLGILPKDYKDTDLLKGEVAEFSYTFENGRLNAGIMILNELEKEIVRLKKGEYTPDFVKTSLGYHLIKLIDERNGEIPSYEEVKDKVKQDVMFNITEKQIEDYYKKHIDKYTEKEQRKVAHILVSDKKKAEEIYNKLKNGADFAELAKKYSEDFTKNKGGVIGYITRGKMSKAFDEVAFSLKKGEISKPVKTEFGYSIIKVLDIKPKKVKPLKEVRNEIIDILAAPKRDQIFNEWLKEMKNKYGVVKYYDNFYLLTKYN
jgi:foldase protein PrsA